MDEVRFLCVNDIHLCRSKRFTDRQSSLFREFNFPVGKDARRSHGSCQHLNPMADSHLSWDVVKRPAIHNMTHERMRCVGSLADQPLPSLVKGLARETIVLRRVTRKYQV